MTFEMDKVIILALLIPMVLFVFGALIYGLSQGKLIKFFYHDILEWHIPDHKQDHYRGINNCSICKICGKEIMQDSQGNWF